MLNILYYLSSLLVNHLVYFFSLKSIFNINFLFGVAGEGMADEEDDDEIDEEFEEEEEDVIEEEKNSVSLFFYVPFFIVITKYRF